jgi:transcriptional regulator with XRE-family HTH domain
MSDLVMAAGEQPDGAVRRRLVGAALRRYRDLLGFGLAEAAYFLDCDRSKISRIETGQRGIRPRELRDLLTEYGVSADEQAVLLAITDARIARGGWWQDYADITPAAHRDLMLMEMFASEILIYDDQQVPDLLQTQDYARALAGAALRQQAGNAGVMRDQLRWLAEANRASLSIRLQVLPFGTGTHPARTVPMSILRFAEAPSLGVVHLRGLNGGVFLTGQAAVAGHVQAFTYLQASALPPDQSAELIREMTGARM